MLVTAGGHLMAQSFINMDYLIKIKDPGQTQDKPYLFNNKYVKIKNVPFRHNSNDLKGSVSARDSAQAYKLLVQASQNYRRFKSEENEPAKLSLLKTMQPDLEQALRLHPNNKTIQQYLSLTYQLLSRSFEGAANWADYVLVNTRRMSLMEPKNNFSIYFSLGKAYLKLEEYDFGRAAYDSMVSNLFSFYEDSLMHGSQRFLRFLYLGLSGRGSCEEKLYLQEQALRSWRHALTVSPENNRAYIQGKIEKTLLWDGGNLLAIKKRNEAYIFYNEKKHKQAKAVFKEVLPQLQTDAAKTEINRLIAQIDFHFLENRYLGLNRMWKIVKNYPHMDLSSDSLKTDSLFQIYKTDYANMCLRQGVQELNSHHRRRAYIYLSKAAELEWHLQSSACFYMVYLLSNNAGSHITHAEEIVKYGARAWGNQKNPLPESLRKQIATFISKAYQQKGDFEMAQVWLQKAYL